MPSTDLEYRFLGRRLIKPFSLAVSLSMLVLVWMMVGNLAVGTVLDGWQGDLAGGAAGVASFLLIVGWWVQSVRMLEHGLLVSTGVWTAVAGYLAIELGVVNPNVMLASCWLVGAGGSWLLERGSEK